MREAQTNRGEASKGGSSVSRLLQDIKASRHELLLLNLIRRECAYFSSSLRKSTSR